jgi:guanylate kinase
VIFVLIGPPGAGKTTLGKVLEELGMKKIVSHTTRPRREGEVDGVDMHFCSESQFINTEFFEVSPLSRPGCRYGTSKWAVNEALQSSNGAYAIVDKYGAISYKDAFGDQCKIIMIYAYKEELKRRVITRNCSQMESKLQEIDDVENMMECMMIAEFHILNNNLDYAIERLKGTVEYVSTCGGLI